MVNSQPRYFYKSAPSFHASPLDTSSAATSAIQTQQITMFSSSSFNSSHFVVPKIAVDVMTLPPTCVRFRQPKVSASYAAAAEKTMSHIATPASLYDVLGIQMGATCQEIKAAYRRLARVSHPDVVASGQKDSSANEFIKIHAAYATLSDPEKRADYDRTLFRRRRPVSSPFVVSSSAAGMGSSSSASVFSGRSRLRWETDQCW